MLFRGPFQPLTFCHSVAAWQRGPPACQGLSQAQGAGKACSGTDLCCRLPQLLASPRTSHTMSGRSSRGLCAHGLQPLACTEPCIVFPSSADAGREALSQSQAGTCLPWQLASILLGWWHEAWLLGQGKAPPAVLPEKRWHKLSLHSAPTHSAPWPPSPPQAGSQEPYLAQVPVWAGLIVSPCCSACCVCLQGCASGAQ